MLGLNQNRLDHISNESDIDFYFCFFPKHGLCPVITYFLCSFSSGICVFKLNIFNWCIKAGLWKKCLLFKIIVSLLNCKYNIQCWKHSIPFFVTFVTDLFDRCKINSSTKIQNKILKFQIFIYFSFTAMYRFIRELGITPSICFRHFHTNFESFVYFGVYIIWIERKNKLSCWNMHQYVIFQEVFWN